MRLFVSVKPDNKTLYALSLMQEQMKKQGVRGNYSQSSNLHITLAFIGEYNDPSKALDVMKTVRFTPFTLTLCGVGNFDDLYFADIKISDNMKAYASALRAAFDRAGIPYDRKKFTPHITLLRRASKPVMRDIITVKNTKMTADRVYLMRSDRGENGMIYTPLGFAAKDETETK